MWSVDYVGQPKFAQLRAPDHSAWLWSALSGRLFARRGRTSEESNVGRGVYLTLAGYEPIHIFTVYRENVSSERREPLNAWRGGLWQL